MISASSTTNLRPHSFVEQICLQMGIAYSSSLVSQLLADLEVDSVAGPNLKQWNEIGRKFGFCFRPVTGSIRQMVNQAKESELIFLPGRQSGSESYLLRSTDRKSLTLFDGSEQRVSAGLLKKEFGPVRRESITWYLVHPLLAAENASQFSDQVLETQKKT